MKPFRLTLLLAFVAAVGLAPPVRAGEVAVDDAEPASTDTSVSDDASSADDTATDDAEAEAEAQAKAKAQRSIALAVLAFDASDPAGNKEMGTQVADTVEAILSSEPNLRVVTRRELSRILEEQKITLAGVVNADEAVRVGRLIGARILVTGRIFVLGERRFLTAKLIGTETGLVKGILVKGSADTDIVELVFELSDKLTQTLRTEGKSFVAFDAPEVDPTPTLRRKLADRQRPTVAVVIPESHRSTAIPDPACETEIKMLLRACDITIVSVKDDDAKAWLKDGKPTFNEWPTALAKADYIITGEAFSEFGTRIEGLVSCSARAEVSVISREGKTIEQIGRTTTTGVHLAEQTAAKRALQNAGREIGLDILRHFAMTLPPAEKAEDDKPAED